ncbi:hypothetical protein INT43_004526 [Umbelopsis isabellina]|uniref:Uncharacterized protein n=1 Tax=Mortierella isabellina TaxID=91625 RepID=A0A8H7UAU9_MORIS|nr:hypothetical protein INT43_004526 [Umbelopsis isabellina]
MSNNISSHRHQDSSASRHEFTSPLIPRTIPLDPPSAGRSGLSSRRRFQLEADMRRESLAFFRKLDHGHADVSFDLLSNEWNEMINDPLIDHDADSPIQKVKSVRRPMQGRALSSYRPANALNSTPIRPSIPLFKSSPFAASPKLKYDGDTDNDTSEFDTIGPPALSAGSLKALENLSPMQPPRARFDLQSETTEERPARVTIPSQQASSFPPGSPSERKGRVIVAPTAPKTPERTKRPSSPIRFTRSSPNKPFPRSSLGTPRGFKSTLKPSSPRSQTLLNHYPDTPTRQPVNIARTPARIHEYKPSDSPEEEQPLSPPKLDFEGVLADYNDPHSAENDNSLSIPLSPAERCSSQPSQEPQSHRSNTHISPNRLPNTSSSQTNFGDSPNRSIDEGVFLISATGQSQTRSNDPQSALPPTLSTDEVIDREIQGSPNKSDPITPQKAIRTEDPGSASSIRKVRDFWEKLSVSSAEKLASVTRSLDIWSPSINKQTSSTSPLKRRISSGDRDEQRKIQKTSDSIKSTGSGDLSPPSTSDNMLYSKLRLHNTHASPAHENEESDDKENKLVAGDFRKSISSLPMFKETNSPIARRRTEEFGKMVTPDRTDMGKVSSKSVETQFTKRHLARNLFDELKSQPLPKLRPVSDRRTSRNLIDALGSDDTTTTEIVRKRNDFKQNFHKFEDNIKQSEEVNGSPGQETSPSRDALNHHISPISRTSHKSPAVKKHSTDDDDWVVPYSTKQLQKSSNTNTYSLSPARVMSKSPLRDRYNRFVSPKRPMSHKVPETPIPQTPKSAMLFAERKLTRGSGLDYASLPTPVKPSAARFAAGRHRAERKPEQRSEPADENVLYFKPERDEPKVKDYRPAATLMNRHEKPTVDFAAEKDQTAVTVDQKADAVMTRKASPTEKVNVLSSQVQKHTESQLEATVEGKAWYDEREQLDEWDDVPKHSAIVEAVNQQPPQEPKTDTTTPAMTGSFAAAAKRKRESDAASDRQRTKRKVNKIPPAQRPSRIPLATWRIAKMNN